MNQKIENTKYENLDCKLEIGIWTENENEKIEGDEDENMKPRWTFLFLFIKNFQCKGKPLPFLRHLRFLPTFLWPLSRFWKQKVPKRSLKPVR